MSRNFCQIDMEPIGQYIRQLREEKKMPLRKLAALLDLDPSTLSKIERQERFIQSSQIPILAEIFEVKFKQLQIRFWKEKLVKELGDEEYIIEALKETVLVLEKRKKLISRKKE